MDDIVVLIVDQDDDTRQETATCVENEHPGATVLLADTRKAAMNTVIEQSVDVLVTGYTLGDGTGLELVADVRDGSSETGCILYSRAEPIETDSSENVVVEFVGKDAPDATDDLIALIGEAGTKLTQSAYPVPEGEAARIDAAANILDSREQLTGPHDRIAQLATDHFDVEASAVTVVLRDRQEPLGQSGRHVAPPEREESLATHTLVQDDGVLAVAETQADPRFAETEPIQSAGIVSYLGAVVKAPTGTVVGVLSVYDDQPREFSRADQEYIERLAHLSGDLLALDAMGGPA